MTEFVYRRSYRGPLKAAVLDWAGTTVDYGCLAPAVVFIEAFRSRGIEVTMAQAREPMGMHKREHIRQLTLMEPVRQQWREKFGANPGEADVDSIFEEFEPLQIEILSQYAELVPGCLDAVAALREKGLKIGSTTGYTRAIMDVLEKEAAARGYAPDVTVCGSDTTAGRPAPYMAFLNAMKLGVYPMEAMVKIGDTRADIYEGLNAGMWTVGLTVTGNEMGLSPEDVAALDEETRERRRRRAVTTLVEAGAHYVVDGITDVPPLIDEINARLARGEKP